MQTGNSHIAKLLDLIAHQISGDGRLFGYRNVTGSSTNN
jgi:hypothetical protein